MSEPFKDDPVAAPVPDAEALVARVRAGVAEKIGRGGYAPAVLEEIGRIERELRGRIDFGPAPADDIALLSSSWDPLGPHEFASHRPGLGRFVVAAKQWLRRLARPCAAVVLARQAEFNHAVARLLAGAAHGVQSLEDGSDVLRHRLGEVERGNRELQARCDRLHNEIRDLQERLGSAGPAEKPR